MHADGTDDEAVADVVHEPLWIVRFMARECHGAGGRAHRAGRREHRFRDGIDVGARCDQRVDTVRHAWVAGAKRRGRYEGDLDGGPGGSGVVDESDSIEQEVRPLGVPWSRRGPERGDERVLSTGDGFHVAREQDIRCATLALPMKAKLLKPFEDQLQALNRELKHDLPKEIQKAREHGDLRENAEYHAAKERQRLVESQISLLQRRVSEIALMNLDKLPTDRVAFGSRVELREPDGGTTTYELVMPEDADPVQGMISTASPIGRALVGKKVGDEVRVPTPNGLREFGLVKLTTLHEIE